MISTVDYISVKNNEILSSDLILKSIKEKKIIYLYNESNKFEKFLIDIFLYNKKIIKIKVAGSMFALKPIAILKSKPIIK